MNLEKIFKGGVSGVKDNIDYRDYPYEYLFGGGTDIDTCSLSEKILDLEDDYQNQNLQEISYYMCVPTSTVHGDNIMNSISGLSERTDLLDLGLKMYNLGRLDLKYGSYLSDGPKTLIEMGKLDGTANIFTIGGYIDSINNNRPVILGSSNINRIITKLTGYASKGSGYSHCFLGIGYNSEGIIIKNTFGNKWGVKNGKFILKWENFDLLFYTKISLINNDIFKKINRVKSLIKYDIKNIANFNIYRDGYTKYLAPYIGLKNDIQYKINHIAWLSLLNQKIAKRELRNILKTI